MRATETREKNSGTVLPKLGCQPSLGFLFDFGCASRILSAASGLDPDAADIVRFRFLNGFGMVPKETCRPLQCYPFKLGRNSNVFTGYPGLFRRPCEPMQVEFDPAKLR